MPTAYKLIKRGGVVRKNSVIVFEKFYGPIPAGFQVDHRDRNTRNDDPSNLRLATLRQQRANQEKRRDSRNRFKGVRKLPHGKWQARLCDRNLGIYSSEEEAARAYDRAAIDEFGEFACINFKGG